MRQAQKATEDVGASGEKSSQQATSALSRMAQSAQQNKEAWTTAGTALTAIGAGMLGVTAAVLKTGIAYNTLQQQSRAALTTLLGSAKAANEQMDKLDAFARTSPFAKQTFITAQQQMLAFGIETKKVIPYLDAIQNAVAAAGGTNQQLSDVAFIISQIGAAGKITATDLMQLGQRGINAAELIGSQMNMTGAQVRASITAGSLDAGKALDALAAGMQAKFGGAAKNVKDTMVGATDRIKAAWRDMASEMVKPLVNPNGGGLLVDASNSLADFMRLVEKAPEPIKLMTGAMFSLVGVAATLGGGFLLLAPRIVATRTALAELGVTASAVRGSLLSLNGLARTGAGLALMAQQSGAFGKSLQQSKAVAGALLGTMVAPGWGTAIGGLAGGILDLTGAIKGAGNSLNDWTPAQKEARQRLDEMARANTLLNRGLGLTAEGAATAAASVKSFADQVDAMNRRLSTRANMRDFQQSIDDFTKSLHDNGRTLDINTQQGRDNQAALDDIASTALKVAENMKGLNRVKFLQGARRDFIAAATQAGLTRAAAQKLADRLIGLNQIHAKPSVEVKGLTAAQAQLKTIMSTMNALSGKHVDTYLTTHRTTLGGILGGDYKPGKNGSADGSTVPRDGGPYSDRFPYMLAPGEEVISNRFGQADRHRGLLKAINAGALADGGTARHPNRLTASELQSASHSFDLTGSMSVAQANKEIAQFAYTIRRDGGHFSKSLEGLTSKVDKTVGHLGKVNDRLASLKDLQSQAASSAFSAFNHDPFGGSLADFATQVSADRNDANREHGYIATALKHGLDPKLAAQLEASGNVDLAAQFAGLSSSQLKYYSNLYSSQQHAATAVSHQASAALAPEVKALAAQVKHLTAALNKQEKKIENAVGRGAEKGTREGAAAAAKYKNQQAANRRATK